MLFFEAWLNLRLQVYLQYVVKCAFDGDYVHKSLYWSWVIQFLSKPLHSHLSII